MREIPILRIAETGDPVPKPRGLAAVVLRCPGCGRRLSHYDERGRIRRQPDRCLVCDPSKRADR